MIMSQWSRRTQLCLWVAAVVVSLLPAAVGVAASLLGVNSQGYGRGFILSPGQCGGWWHQADVLNFPGYGYLSAKPYLVIVPAFLVWLVTGRRAVGWAVVAILVPVALAEPALLGYDVARWGRTCLHLWQPLLPAGASRGGHGDWCSWPWSWRRSTGRVRGWSARFPELWCW
ncbi:hypothetical protein E1200_11045 [Actinomadura sp. GC306]|uniref:hypothetical protein n=1 Tax=Actinomadura sp. GC306 TaxID=2530367 RepID=UPI00104568FF|nr:hypothetical protein [Actinomadura sp. GC306]TDC68665.1 hypothetical protein E1200_11045 [Actinomadura sp. GC306]